MADPCRFAGSSVKHLYILISFNQSSYVLHLERDGGVLELFQAIL